MVKQDTPGGTRGLSDEELASLLQRYRDERGGRLGGVYALSGFDFQLRCYLADYVTELAAPNQLEITGTEFAAALESFSDYTRRDVADTVCVQVKTTLRLGSLRAALAEFADIERFLRLQSGWRPQYEIVTQHIAVNLDWDALYSGDPEILERLHVGADVGALLEAGRLLPIRVEPDPWWRLLSASYDAIDDPFSFARSALDRCLALSTQPTSPGEIRDAIAEEFAARRRNPRLPGSILRREDFVPDPVTGSDVVIGNTPTLRHLRAGNFMDRPDQVASVVRTLNDVRQGRDAENIEEGLSIFWIDGRSGSGKSVLLLEVMRALTHDQSDPVIWFGQATEDIR